MTPRATSRGVEYELRRKPGASRDKTIVLWSEDEARRRRAKAKPVPKQQIPKPIPFEDQIDPRTCAERRAERRGVLLAKGKASKPGAQKGRAKKRRC